MNQSDSTQENLSAESGDLEVEGLDTDNVSGWGDYPLDAVFVRKDQRTVGEVVKRIKAGRYDLNPDFQRDFIWDTKKQSRLIESCLMRIPLPVFYVAEAKDGRIIVVDGLQRLTTFMRYLNNGFGLTGLGDDGNEKANKNPLLRKKFKDLPINLQERIEDTQITLYILDAQAPERARLDIFERVNGGVPLTRQQMRNCLYNGQATTLLRKLAGNEYFYKATGGSLNAKTMRDREVINRFCAFKLCGVEGYNGDMDDFLAISLGQMNELDQIGIHELEEEFVYSMRANIYLFGRHSFRKSMKYNEDYYDRTVINVSLFDVMSVVLSETSRDLIKSNKTNIQRKFSELLDDSDFLDAITYSTNQKWKVGKRFELAEQALAEALE